MFSRIVGQIKTDKVPTIDFLCLRQGELGIDESNDEFPGSSKRLVHIRSLELEIHRPAVTEVVEEDEHLEDFGLLHDLDPRRARFPFLVDGYDHSSAGYGEAGHDADMKREVSGWVTRE